MKHFVIIILLQVFFYSFTQAQESKHEEGAKGFHQFSIMLSHSHTEDGFADGSKKWISSPSFGFDYNYWISNHWAIGLHTDVITETIKVVDAGGEILERTNPFAAVPAVVFKPKEHSTFVVGMGGEFAKEEHFALTRLGYEYAWELPKHFELSLGLTYDIKWKAYDTWTFGVIISKFLK